MRQFTSPSLVVVASAIRGGIEVEEDGKGRFRFSKI